MLKYLYSIAKFCQEQEFDLPFAIEEQKKQGRSASLS